MRVVCVLEELLRDHPDIDNATFAARIGVVERTAAKIRRNARDWRLTRENLEKLTVFAYEFGYEHGIFEVRHHPLWSSFEKSPAKIFRGDGLPDARVEADAREFLGRIHSENETVIVRDNASTSEKRVADAMSEMNCLFVGSPRHNPASEIALALLWSAKAFDTSRANRQKLPFQMIRNEAAKENSAVISTGKHCGFEVHGPGVACFVPVSWFPPDVYNKWHGEGYDATMIVVCRSPLGTKRNVTSVIVSGYTGLATYEAMHELIAGEPPLNESDLQQVGKPHLLGYFFSFAKPKGHRRLEFGEQRKAIGRSGCWAPPWEAIAET